MTSLNQQDYKRKIKTLATFADAKMIENWSLKEYIKYQDRVIRRLQTDFKTVVMRTMN